MDWEVPQEFFDLLNKLEQDELQQDVASQSNNKSTQINGGEVKQITTNHQLMNTDIISKADKAVNTDPLIILEPSDIDKLCGGFKMLTFDHIPQIFLSTTNSNIKPSAHPKSTKIGPVPQPSSINNSTRVERESGKINKIKKRDQLKSKPKFAHMKSESVDWLAHVQAAAKSMESMEETVPVSSDTEDDKTRPSTPTNVDENFKSQLNELFGEISP